MKLPITDDGIRPAGSPDKCFYCGSMKGEHKDDCVCIQRTVVVEMTIRYAVEVPNYWTQENIEFHRGESSFCMGNDIEQLYDENEAEPNTCRICRRIVSLKYIREANEADMEPMEMAKKAKSEKKEAEA